MKKYKKQEESTQIAVCKYLKLKYPDIIFISESSGVKLTMGQAVKAKMMRSEGKLPDMIILEPKGAFNGLALELKRPGEKVFKKDGEPYAGHICEQYKTLKRLEKKGYLAQFAIGFDQARTIIDSYMK